MTPIDVNIEIVGGFALVLTNTETLVIGTVATHGIGTTCDYPQHGMELRLSHGDYDDQTGIPSAPPKKRLKPSGEALPALFKRRWVLDGYRGVIGGLSAEKLNLPHDGKSQTPKPPKDNSPYYWNDLQYTYQPLTYHSGAKLHSEWDSAKFMPTALRVSFGGLTMLEPDPLCLKMGNWKGKNKGGKEKFSKTLNSMARLTAHASGPIDLAFGDEHLILKPLDGRIDLKLIAMTPFSDAHFEKGRAAEHMGMFYGLCVDSSNKQIDCKERFLPFYDSECNEEPQLAASPGSGCPNSVFIQE